MNRNQLRILVNKVYIAMVLKEAAEQAKELAAQARTPRA